MSFSLWPSSLPQGRDLGKAPDVDEEQPLTPALDLLAIILSVPLNIRTYELITRSSRWENFVHDTNEPRFIGIGGFATVEVGIVGGRFVAIKRSRLFHQDDDDIQARHNRGLVQTTLETRILSLQELREHENIINIEGLCYEEISEKGITVDYFHLILEYSSLGNLAFFLRNHTPNLDDETKVDLVRQVGSGLSSLHAFHICHGDLKLQNVIVFEGRNNFFIAKLADFGISVHSHEEHIRYPPGTPLLNAPEIRNQHLKADVANIKTVIMADIFSFGLLTWEVMRNGQSYFDSAWLNAPEVSNRNVELEEQIAFLASLQHNELLNYGEKYLVALNLDATAHQQILRVFQATLQDDPFQRKQILSIIKDLAASHNNTIDKITSIRNNWAPGLSGTHLLMGFPSWNDERVDLSVNLLVDLPQAFQKTCVDELTACALWPSLIMDNLDDKRADAAKLVAESYLISFGVDFDPKQVIHWLELAISYRPDFSLYLDRVYEAFSHFPEVSRTGEPGLLSNSATGEPETAYSSGSFFVNRIQTIVSSSLEAAKEPSGIYRPLEAEIRSELALRTGLRFDSDMSALEVAIILGDDKAMNNLLLTMDVSVAHEKDWGPLHYACIGGNLNALRLVLNQAASPSHVGEQDVTALHLLVFMPPDAVFDAVDLLVANGAVADVKSGPVNFKDTKLRLLGTPLQWAVTTRHRVLVNALLPHSKGQEHQVFRYAIFNFYYDIVADLLTHDSVQKVASQGYQHAFAVGEPFMHLIAHGRESNVAVEKTIRICHEHGLFDEHHMLRHCIEFARTPACFRAMEVLLEFCPPSVIRYGSNHIHKIPRSDDDDMPTLYLAFIYAKSKKVWKPFLKRMVESFSVEELSATRDGSNCLQEVVHQRWETALRVLLEKGLSVQEELGVAIACSAYDLAVRTNNVRMEKVLAEYGGKSQSGLEPDLELGWWLMDQQRIIDSGPAGTTHGQIERHGEVVSAAARHMHTLLMQLLSCRDQTFSPVTDDRGIFLAEKLWKNFRALAATKSVLEGVNVPDDSGVTMLQRAAAYVDTDVVRLLLDMGADANMAFLAKTTNSDGGEIMVPWLPFDVACWTGRWQAHGLRRVIDDPKEGAVKKSSPLHKLGQLIHKSLTSRGPHDHYTWYRRPTPGSRAADALREKSVEVATELLRWHQLRGDSSFDGITELHLYAHTQSVDRYLQKCKAMIRLHMDIDPKASWPGMEGRYTPLELSRANLEDFKRTWNYRVFRNGRSPKT